MMLPNLSNLMNLERPRLEGEDIDYIVSPLYRKKIAILAGAWKVMPS